MRTTRRRRPLSKQTNVMARQPRRVHNLFDGRRSAVVEHMNSAAIDVNAQGGDTRDPLAQSLDSAGRHGSSARLHGQNGKRPLRFFGLRQTFSAVSPERTVFRGAPRSHGH
jgi:hypothetical protein